MKTLKIKVKLSIGYATAIHNEILYVEVDDDATEEEIKNAKQEATESWANNFIEYSYIDF